ncbi:Uncharacterised protein [Mycobacteroides abscessus subsp. abscessus]|nr:Uncharacterised protein [Mycobacteroides abscessus subsp. abscessus]
MIAAVNISTQATRHSVASIRADLVPPLLAAAARIEQDLRNTNGPARGRGGA